MESSGFPEFNGMSYKSKNFTPQDIYQHLSLYNFQGLSLSPQLKMKTKLTYVKKVQGNYTIAGSIAPNSDKGNRHFKKYFACHNTHRPIPNRKHNPSWKVQPFKRHLNVVFIQAMVLPEKIIGWTDYHVSWPIRFKNDNIVQENIWKVSIRFNLIQWLHVQILFLASATTKKHLNEGLYKLYSWIMFMFDQLKPKHHSVLKDNLDMSDYF